MTELTIQKFLRTGGTFKELERLYRVDATPHARYENLIQFHYDMFASPTTTLVRECRGLILDSEHHWNVVARAMDKFPTHGDGWGALPDWNSSRVFEKVDGTLAILYAYDGRWHWATSGFPDARGKVDKHGFTFAELINKTFCSKPWFGMLPPTSCGKTFWFELTSRFSKIVVHQEEPALTLLGARDMTTQQELTLEVASGFFPGCPVVKSYPIKGLENVLAALEGMDGTKQEGFVVCDAAFNRTKLKCSDYSRLHLLRDRFSSIRGIVDVVRFGRTSEAIAEFPELKDRLLEVHSRYSNLLEELHTKWKEYSEIEDQKEFALRVKDIRGASSLFAVRKGKTRTFEEHIKGLHVDSVLSALGYKGTD
jgi:RNA ligase-like protein